MAKKTTDTVESLQQQLSDLSQQLVSAQESEKRALADYQNLVRRQRDEKIQLLKFAAKEVVEKLLEPLSHLSLASQTIKDPGLTLVVEQLWKNLGEIGLQEIDPQGQPFDVLTMEVVEKQGEGDTVIKVMSKGYSLNGDIIRHARVVVG